VESAGRQESDMHASQTRARAHPRVRPRAFSFTFAGVLDARTPLQVKLFPVSQAASLIPEGFATLSLSLSFLLNSPPRSLARARVRRLLSLAA